MNNNNKHSVQKIHRIKYSPQFKDQALERAEKEGIPQVAKDLGIAETMLYSWRAKKQQFGSGLENKSISKQSRQGLRERIPDYLKKMHF